MNVRARFRANSFLARSGQTSMAGGGRSEVRDGQNDEHQSWVTKMQGKHTVGCVRVTYYS